ncbi:transposase [Streptomyces sp. NPDC057411]|uniref:transposase n=1 Tax=unclassified Streptomyces TaxID=2593676 RepID=UPI00363D9DFF
MARGRGCSPACGPGGRRRGAELGRLGGLHDRAGSPARGRGAQKGAPVGEPDDHAIGRSLGGLTTKIHLAADGNCRPLAFHLTAGQAGDAPAFADVMARLRVPRRRGRRPRTRSEAVLADKAYSSRAIREHLRRRGIRAVVTLRVPRNDAHQDDRGLSSRRRPLRVWLNPEHGQNLLNLGFELCWATTWMGDANRWIAPVLGLPELPFVDFGEVLLRERPDGVHWKTGPLVEYAGGRPFAWVDDEQSDVDQTYVTAHHQGPGLLHHVNPRIGLREDDFRALSDFAQSLDTSRTTR